eukprot:TRINITY_DN796_c0_g4_i2.p1 TRINITY_DN796_c0_g4~~TRINITY_DN796_c0_g4_i2.p1  ORF type:complete len:168 (+),score=58.90 TRINITY_DN796_c0_g4_i2:92-595(+)
MKHKIEKSAPTPKLGTSWGATPAPVKPQSLLEIQTAEEKNKAKAAPKPAAKQAPQRAADPSPDDDSLFWDPSPQEKAASNNDFPALGSEFPPLGGASAKKPAAKAWGEPKAQAKAKAKAPAPTPSPVASGKAAAKKKQKQKIDPSLFLSFSSSTPKGQSLDESADDE